jgi:hypothetical protein
MTTLRNVRTLTRHKAWANGNIYDVVAALPTYCQVWCTRADQAAILPV